MSNIARNGTVFLVFNGRGQSANLPSTPALYARYYFALCLVTFSIHSNRILSIRFLSRELDSHLFSKNLEKVDGGRIFRKGSALLHQDGRVNFGRILLVQLPIEVSSYDLLATRAVFK